MTDPHDSYELDRMIDSVGPADLIQALCDSDASLEDKVDIAFNVLKLVKDPEVKVRLFRGLKTTILADTAGRAHAVTQNMRSSLNINTGPLSDRAAVEAVADVLRFTSLLFEDISIEISEEIYDWSERIGQTAEAMPEQTDYPCAHCGTRRSDMFAIMDGFVLCLTTSDGVPSCYTRVHDYGEPLGSAVG